MKGLKCGTSALGKSFNYFAVHPSGAQGGLFVTSLPREAMKRLRRNFSVDSFFFLQSGRQERETKDFSLEETLQKQRPRIIASQITQLGHVYLIMEEIFPRKKNSVGEILIGFLSSLRLCVKFNHHHHRRRRESPCTTPLGQWRHSTNITSSSDVNTPTAIQCY